MKDMIVCLTSVKRYVSDTLRNWVASIVPTEPPTSIDNERATIMLFNIGLMETSDRTDLDQQATGKK